MSALWAADLGEVINLGKGHPNPNLLPLHEVHAAFASAAKRPSAAVDILQYGRMQGNPALCAAISSWLARAANRSTTPRPEQLLITTGAGPALAVVAQLFTKPGDTVIVDAPGYFLSFFSFDDCRLRVVSVRTDANGLDVDRVEELCEEGLRPAMVYTVPVANNPTGVGMSDERKKKLVHLARKYQFKIASDEVYTFLKFDSETIPRSLFEFDDPSDPVVFSLNSFSKVLGPGMRLGWIATHESHMPRLLDCGTLQSGGGFNPMASAVVLEMLESGFVERQVRVLQKHYAKTRDVLCAAVDEHLRAALQAGEELSYEDPEGGFFCFVTLPERFDADRLLDIAQANGVSFFPGKHSSPDKKGFRSSVRLCFAFVDEDTIVEGVKRLAKAMRQY